MINRVICTDVLQDRKSSNIVRAERLMEFGSPEMHVIEHVGKELKGIHHGR